MKIIQMNQYFEGLNTDEVLGKPDDVADDWIRRKIARLYVPPVTEETKQEEGGVDPSTVVATAQAPEVTQTAEADQKASTTGGTAINGSTTSGHATTGKGTEKKK